MAAFFLILPAFGLLILASDFDAFSALVFAFTLVGLAFGGEGDILGYLVVRYFGIEVYSTVLGCVMAAIGAAIALGAVLLSITLQGAGTFTPIPAVCGSRRVDWQRDVPDGGARCQPPDGAGYRIRRGTLDVATGGRNCYLLNNR